MGGDGAWGKFSAATLPRTRTSSTGCSSGVGAYRPGGIPRDGTGRITCDGTDRRVGNGLCSNRAHCCSKWGFCGTVESGHCVDEHNPPEPAPVQAPTAPEPPTGGDENGCCSQNFSTCVSWGSDSKESCQTHGSMIWLENGALTQECREKDGACTDDVDACCPGLICDGSQWYKQCKLGGRRGRAIRSF